MSTDPARAMPAVDEEVLVARAFLSRVVEPGDLALWRLIERLGPVDAAAALRSGRVDAQWYVPIAARCAEADPEADLAAAERHRIRLVVPESPEWPHFAFAALGRAATRLAAAVGGGVYRRGLAGDPVPPVALWVQGAGVELATTGMRSVGLVGARAATSYGEHVTADLAYGARRARCGRGVGRRVRHRCGSAPCRAGGARPDGARLSRRPRPAVPGGEHGPL